MEEEESELSRKIKRKAKRKAKDVLISVMPLLIVILVLIVVLESVFSVFTNIMDKMIELGANLKTRLDSFWKWFTDDYWIKLDKEIEYTEVDEETRTGNNKD